MLRLRGGGKKKATAAQKRLIVQNYHKADPLLTCFEIAEMFGDDYEGSISPSFVRKWWEADRFERKPGSGGKNRIDQTTRDKVVKLCAGFTKMKDGGWKRKASTRLASRICKRQRTPVSQRTVVNIMKEADLHIEFQQDNAGAHFSNVALEFLEEKDVDYWRKGKWPGNSGDLSPIENVWSMLKTHIYQDGEPTTMIGMKRRINLFFRDFSEATCEMMLRGMPRRLQLLKETQFMPIGK